VATIGPMTSKILSHWLAGSAGPLGESGDAGQEQGRGGSWETNQGKPGSWESQWYKVASFPGHFPTSSCSILDVSQGI